MEVADAGLWFENKAGDIEPPAGHMKKGKVALNQMIY